MGSNYRTKKANTANSTIEELEKVILFIHWPGKKVYIGMGLILEQRCKFVEFLRDKEDYFSWSYTNMKMIPPEVITHCHDLSPTIGIVMIATKI